MSDMRKSVNRQEKFPWIELDICYLGDIIEATEGVLPIHRDLLILLTSRSLTLGWKIAFHLNAQCVAIQGFL